MVTPPALTTCAKGVRGMRIEARIKGSRLKGMISSKQ